MISNGWPNLRENLGAVGWKLTAEQVTRLDRASEMQKSYPYWHQDGFDRNPSPLVRVGMAQ